MARLLYRVIMLGVIVLVGAPSLLVAQIASGTLNERAKGAGGKLLLRYSPNRGVIYSSIEELAKQSDIIIIGRTISHRAHLRPDGKFITKDFSVRVLEVFKGEVAMGTLIDVSLPGGAYKFPDGSVALVLPAHYKQPADGGLYALFLKKKGSVYRGHVPASETQALFDLTGGSVQPADLIESDPIVSKYRNMRVADFLAQLHKATPRKLK